jgi:hypothetical protein
MRTRRAEAAEAEPRHAWPNGAAAEEGKEGGKGKRREGLTVGGEAGVEVEEEGETSYTGKKETCARGRGGRERKREAVWGGGGADRRAPLGVAAVVSTARCAHGEGGTRRGAGPRLGRAPSGPPGGAHGGEGRGGTPARPRLEAGPKGREREKFPF